jgi:hypothetical protein
MIIADDDEELVAVKKSGLHVGTEFPTPQAPIAVIPISASFDTERPRAVPLPPSSTSD